MADISSNGVLIRCHEILPHGTIVHLIIGTMRLAVHTSVVVRRQIEGTGLALEFRRMSMTDRDLLRKMMVRLSTSSIIS